MLSIALALAQFAPMIAGWLGGSNAEKVATKVVGIAQAITGQSSPDAALAALQADPAMAMQYQQAVLNQQYEIAKLAQEVTLAEIAADTADTAALNATMQTEAKADHWPTYSWRPFVGFCYGLEGLMTALTVMTCYIGVMFFAVNAAILTYIPQMLGAMAGIMATQTVVLGIASHFRGKMQANPQIATDNRG